MSYWGFNLRLASERGTLFRVYFAHLNRWIVVRCVRSCPWHASNVGFKKLSYHPILPPFQEAYEKQIASQRPFCCSDTIQPHKSVGTGNCLSCDTEGTWTEMDLSARGYYYVTRPERPFVTYLLLTGLQVRFICRRLPSPKYPRQITGSFLSLKVYLAKGNGFHETTSRP